MINKSCSFYSSKKEVDFRSTQKKGLRGILNRCYMCKEDIKMGSYSPCMKACNLWQLVFTLFDVTLGDALFS